jgi:penicillin-binding protein 2
MSRKIKDYQIAPDEIFLDDSNLPELDDNQFEGRIERPISKTTLYLAGAALFALFMIFLGRVAYLQIVQGANYADRSKNNSLRHTVILPPRGIVYDRAGTELAWNKPDRTYIGKPGFSILLGYLGFPDDERATSATAYAEKELIGRAGVERQFNDQLTGQKGVRVEEVNVKGEVVSNHSLRQAESGKQVDLSIDARVQEKLFNTIGAVVNDRGFSGGAGAIMNVRTGELIALVSYPEYDSGVMTSHNDPEAIRRFLSDERKPFLNRAVGGLYAPGSIIKPVMALAALAEGIIDPNKRILSTGQLEIPNPYNPKEKTIFKDWKAHGYIDMRRAIAESSDEYFYQIGGGYQGQKGLGIAKIDKYLTMFGLSRATGFELPEATGTIPTPDWKAKTFNGEPWRLGDTYHTAIGQYGMLVTPLQMVRMAAAIANEGTLLKPTIFKVAEKATSSSGTEKIPIDKKYFDIVHEGMRLGVTDANGTGHGLDIPAVRVASKTGTAELGVSKSKVNSWVIGFWPYDDPKYAFAVAMERGARENTIGGVFVMRTFFDWLAVYLPEYLR